MTKDPLKLKKTTLQEHLQRLLPLILAALCGELVMIGIIKKEFIVIFPAGLLSYLAVKLQRELIEKYEKKVNK